jgi:sugar/nucleoside kinase (ribokinase family)
MTHNVNGGMKMKSLSIAGDVIIDWIISGGECNVYPGGVGNIIRGLKQLGYDTELTTLYNPMLYPLDHIFTLKNSLQDFAYRNVNIRNYDSGMFQRFREGIKSRIFSGTYDVVILHEETCIRNFTATYADVRDITSSGSCKILRLSSSDPWNLIMQKIGHEMAIVTYSDQVKVYNRSNEEQYQLDFPVSPVKDTVGAGDTFSVWFLDGFLKTGEFDQGTIMAAIGKAQEKVGKIGVFI